MFRMGYVTRMFYWIMRKHMSLKIVLVYFLYMNTFTFESHPRAFGSL